MNSFIGKYTSRLDEKGRLVFPAPLKGVLSPDSDMRFVVKKDIFRRCLEMLTYEEWTRETDAMKSRLDFLNPRHASFWSYYTSETFIVRPDDRLGRDGINDTARRLALCRARLSERKQEKPGKGRMDVFQSHLGPQKYPLRTIPAIPKCWYFTPGTPSGGVSHSCRTGK